MLRRIFLFQILLGWLIVIIKKGITIAKPALSLPLFADVKPINLYVALNGNDS